ncbi:PREDICTED: receptor-transporting protein 3 [Elephantulus edwardii]|uniref:receptor-transporting protein 3 n=1 Tax=Elephantulus edwardii TaxID=28737 RepID=UPI0003F0E8B0|nr:PREDICTED: receptor-transporting protein 3 [Elephantulus edwardii]
MAEDIGVWREEFQTLIQEVKPWHTWTLTLDKELLPSTRQPEWVQYKQWSFARFQCSSCSRHWASAQVQVLFHMHWSKGTSQGQVKMRLFGQRCQKCSQSAFEVPEFTQENISRILNNLVLHILKRCYREGFKSMEVIPAIKDIPLEGPHDSGNCEACHQGFCAQRKLDPGQQAPVPSLQSAPQPVPPKNVKKSKTTAKAGNLSCSHAPAKTDKLLKSCPCSRNQPHVKIINSSKKLKPSGASKKFTSSSGCHSSVCSYKQKHLSGSWTEGK